MAENDLMVPAKEFTAESFLPQDLLDGWIRPLIAEMIGPFALVFIGAGAIMTAASQGYANDGGSLVMIALAHGLAIGLMVAAAGHVSGGHYNPAVTIALWAGGKIGTIKGVAYIAAQLVGAVIGALALRYVFNEVIRDATNFGIPTVNYADDGAEGLAGNDLIIVGKEHAFVIEVICTFFLVYVIHGAAVDRRGPHAIAALAIGLTITMDILMAGPLTGAAMNPARWFGPAVVEGDFTDGWLYWIGPIVGGLLAAVCQTYIFIPREQQEPMPEPTEHHD